MAKESSCDAMEAAVVPATRRSLALLQQHRHPNERRQSGAESDLAIFHSPDVYFFFGVGSALDSTLVTRCRFGSTVPVLALKRAL